MSLGKSRKSREKLADTPMTMSGALAVACATATFLAPMGIVINQHLKGEPIDVFALFPVAPSTAALFVVLYTAACVLIMWSRRAAFKIYDSLYPEQ
ncbi:hypothetical protein [Stenotrophomonas oahuensis]|uniref:Uncharacterized protein n=1 Tax=Stenotrophomonas oahuensis TaxID=3003271 RepID=A0ABY9YJQ2_9GAMM|nr:hypothetical protein [Stenotrophomonas sp. A5586]WNH50932.1 hypothetical protein PDM29_11075 [Stenotrophomonas sp. A5586]